MRCVEVEITNASGLHARPAAVFVKTAAGFQSAIHVRNVTAGKQPSNAKSMLGVLSQGVVCGTRVEITADGPDEEQALEALARIVAAGLGEGGAAPA
jgi:phosphocarrier protein HPr